MKTSRWDASTGDGVDHTCTVERRAGGETLLPCAEALEWAYRCRDCIGMQAVITRCGWHAVNAPLKGGQLTTTAAMGNWSIN
jgi:hypothetical protein